MTLLGSWARRCAGEAAGAGPCVRGHGVRRVPGLRGTPVTHVPPVCIVMCLHEAAGTRVLSPRGRASVLFRVERILWVWVFLSPCHLPLMRLSQGNAPSWTRT